MLTLSRIGFLLTIPLVSVGVLHALCERICPQHLWSVAQFAVGLTAGAGFYGSHWRRLRFLSVFVHEANHVAVGLIFRCKPVAFHVNEDGTGSVRFGRFDKANALVLLAPYCMPLLAIVAALLGLIINDHCIVAWRFVTGFFLGMHYVDVFGSFRACQTDLQRTGILFSWILTTFANFVISAFLFASCGLSTGPVDFAATIGKRVLVPFLQYGTPVAGVPLRVSPPNTSARIIHRSIPRKDHSSTE